MSRVHVLALTTAVLVLTASADAFAQAASPAQVPLVADDSEIGAFERDAVPPEINTVPPRRLRDVEFEDLSRLWQLATGAFGQAERTTSPGEHDLGTFLLGEHCNPIGKRCVGEDAGDHNVLAVEKAHACQRNPSHL